MRQNLRQEPYEVIPHVRICAGGVGQPTFLPRLEPVMWFMQPFFSSFLEFFRPAKFSIKIDTEHLSG
jgi:hypothetical protein